MKYKIEQGNEVINGNGGISLLGGLLDKLPSLNGVDKMSFEQVKQGKIPHSGILKSMTGLLGLGKSDYADIELYRQDPLFRESLDLPAVPSESRLRQRLEDMSGIVNPLVLDSNFELLSLVDEFGSIKTEHCEYLPFDADVSPFDNSGSHKEGVEYTYKGHDGFAPMLGYLGTHGYLLNCELRPGSQHSQKGMEEFLEKSLEMIDRLGLLDSVVVRLDSAHDDAENIKIIQSKGGRFLIKRNPRREPPEQWLAMARRVGECESPREGKNIFTGSVSHFKPAGRDDLAPVEIIFEVIERTITADGQELLIPEIEVNTWWTNLPDPPVEVIELYHQHATSEQYHSEYKTDLDLERLPSGKFKTNGLVLLLGMLAFNALRIIGQTTLALKELLPIKLEVTRRRLKSVIQDLMYIGCKRITHGGRTILKFGRHCPWFEVFRQLYLTYC